MPRRADSGGSDAAARGLTSRGNSPGDRETGPRATAPEPRFVRDGAPHRQAHKGKRRGDNFTLRLTPAERIELDACCARDGGPKALGAWLKWAALQRAALPAPAVGIATAAREVLPELGTATAAREVLPELGVLPELLEGNARPGDLSPAALPTRGHCLLEAGTARPGEWPSVDSRIILDLCAGSGAWSEPYRQGGYSVIRVTLPEFDVRTWEPPPCGVWGVLAAPPCDQFSLARNGQPTPRDFEAGLSVVAACLRIIALARPKWWALENPAGMLSRFLGTARDVWEPCDFGDPWTKRTALWGDFDLPVRGPHVKPKGGGPSCAVCDPNRRKTLCCGNKAHRAITPSGFARAFFEANP